MIKDGVKWFCRHCNPKYSDAIEFVMRRDSATFFEACQILKIELDQRSQPRRSAPPRSAPPAPRPAVNAVDFDENKAIFTDTGYQAAALRFVNEASDCLMSPDGDKAREYLTNRGIYRAFFYRNILGFNPTEKREKWGAVDVWLPRGIIIPHWRGDEYALFRINIRRATGDPKYIQPAGCSAHGLYVVGHLRPASTVILTEGEFDAMCLKSSLNLRTDYDRFVVIATGGAHGGRTLRNVAMISAARRVLLAFDLDKAGDDATDFWAAAIGNVTIARPYEHDITDMHHAGNLQAWIQQYL